MVRNPVMFVVEVGTVIVGFLTIYYLFTDPSRFTYNAAILGEPRVNVLGLNLALDELEERIGK